MTEGNEEKSSTYINFHNKIGPLPRILMNSFLLDIKCRDYRFRGYDDASSNFTCGKGFSTESNNSFKQNDVMMQIIEGMPVVLIHNCSLLMGGIGMYHLGQVDCSYTSLKDCILVNFMLCYCKRFNMYLLRVEQ